MILKVLESRTLSMLYIFQIYYDFANISFKKCWQIFRSYKICQHLLDFIVDSTIFDTLKYEKCCQNSAKIKICTTFPVKLQFFL